LLDEIYTPAIFEDVDYCIRAKYAGFKIIYNGRSKLIHYEAKTIKNVNDLDRFFYTQRNELLLYFRYYPFISKLKELLKTFLRAIITKKDSSLPISAKNLKIHLNVWYRGIVILKALLIALTKATQVSKTQLR